MKISLSTFFSNLGKKYEYSKSLIMQLEVVVLSCEKSSFSFSPIDQFCFIRKDLLHCLVILRVFLLAFLFIFFGSGFIKLNLSFT